VIFTTIPGVGETVADLGHYLELVYAGLEHGVAEARAHFQQTGIGMQQEKQAFSTLVRLHAKDYLKRRNLESAELEHTNLCGIWLRIGNYHLKVWRVSDEDLEIASQPASGIFEQFQFLENGEPIALVRLRVYWRLDERGLLKAYLAYPKYDDPKSAECHWLTVVAEPATAIPEAPALEHEDVPVEALPIGKAAAGK
jgi:hypothetical protein